MRSLAKFENVNVTETLQKIMEHNTEFYQSDFLYDVDMIRKAAGNDDEQKGIFWMSRKCGTWVFDEKNVFIRNTPDYRTWRNYRAELDGVKAFWVRADHKQEGIVIGSILELDYERMKKEFSTVEVNAESVWLAFKNQENSRIFPVFEFEENRQAIVQRYGGIQRIIYYVKDEEVLESHLDTLFEKLYQDAEPMDIDSYIDLMDKERFEGCGYEKGDLHFITPAAARNGLEHHLNVYGVRKDTGAVRLQSTEDVEDYIRKYGTFGMTAEEKTLLSFMNLGNGIDGLFTKEEQDALYRIVLQAGISGYFPQQQIDSITHKLECVMGRCDSEEACGEDMELER